MNTRSFLAFASAATITAILAGSAAAQVNLGDAGVSSGNDSGLNVGVGGVDVNTTGGGVNVGVGGGATNNTGGINAGVGDGSASNNTGGVNVGVGSNTA